MATTNFNNIVLAVARRVKSSRTDPTSSGDSSSNRYTSALLAEYVNRSIRRFLIEQFQKYGEKAFMEVFPDYVITAPNAISVTAGVGAKPSDCFTIVDLFQQTTLLKFFRLDQKDVRDIVSGLDKSIVPSSTAPAFYEEGSNFYTLGVTSGSVFPRYIKTHQDITPTTGVAGNGNYCTDLTLTAFTVATRVISAATMHVSFASTDVGKKLILFDSTAGVVYDGVIDARLANDSVSITGADIPTGNIAAGHIGAVLVIDKDINDLTLNKYWHPQIVDMAVTEALADAKANVQ